MWPRMAICDEMLLDDDVPGSADTIAIGKICNEVIGYGHTIGITVLNNVMHGEHHCHGKENERRQPIFSCNWQDKVRKDAPI